MPHIVIKCYKGRSEEVKTEIAEKTAKYVAELFDMPEKNVSCSIEEVDKSEWKEIYDNEILGKPDQLYVKPGYEM